MRGGLQNLGSTAGYIVGAVVILPLLLIAYNHFFINKNNAAPFINTYINNSTNIKVEVPPNRPENVSQTAENMDDYPLVTSKKILAALATKNMGRDDSKKSTMRYRIFYDKALKKYFSITMFDLYHKGVSPLEDDFWIVINKSNIYMRVNNDDLKNPDYGSKEHPIPVFKVWGANSPLTADYGVNNPINYDVSDEQYKYNVMVYLTFVMPKKEFKERFKN